MSLTEIKIRVGGHQYPINTVEVNKIIKKKRNFDLFVRKTSFDIITRFDCEKLLKIAHLNVQRIFQHEVFQEHHYLAMESCGNLTDFLKAKSKIEPEELLRLIKESTKGLKYLHENDILHKNLSPESIFIEKNHAKVAFFGVVELTFDKAFLAPEVLNNPETLSKDSDVFSLGKIFLYAFLYEKSRDYTRLKLKLYRTHLEELKEVKSFNDIDINFRQISLSKLADNLLSTPKERSSCDKILNNILFWNKFKIFKFLSRLDILWHDYSTSDRFKSKFLMKQNWTQKVDPKLLNSFDREKEKNLTGLAGFWGRNVKYFENKFYARLKHEHILTYMNNFATEIIKCFEICCDIAARKTTNQEYAFKELEECFPQKIFSPIDILSSHEEQGVGNNYNELETNFILNRKDVECSKKLLGEGQFKVYEGKLRIEKKETKVAIKMIEKTNVDEIKREIKNLIKQSESGKIENVIEVFGTYDDPLFYPLVLEYALANLKGFLLNENDEFTEHLKIFQKKQILHDSVKGVLSFHENRIIHMDLNPKNILIVDRYGDGKLRACIADFGKSKEMMRLNATSASIGMIGTKKWFSPEMRRYAESLKRKNTTSPDITTASDIYQLGLIFGYVLIDPEFHKKKTKSKKRKGQPKKPKKKTKVDQKKEEMLEKYRKENGNDFITEFVIKYMIYNNHEERLDAYAVDRNPFFWEFKRIEQYLNDVKTHFKRSGVSKVTKVGIEDEAVKRLFNKNQGWISIIDNQEITNEIKSCSKTQEFNEMSFFDLIDFIFILKADENSENFRRAREITSAASSEDFWKYWLNKFEYLLPFAYYNIKIPKKEYYSPHMAQKPVPKRRLSYDKPFKRRKLNKST